MFTTVNSKKIISRERGFTLIEIIVGIVAFAILMSLIISVFAPQVIRGTDPLFSIRAAELGQSYLEEIIGKRFAETSPSGNQVRCGETPPTGPINACSASMGPDGETRAQYDDVDDYNGLNESPPLDSNGSTRSGYNGFRVQVNVATAGADIGLTAGDAKRINVTVTAANGDIFVFSAYKANF